MLNEDTLGNSPGGRLVKRRCAADADRGARTLIGEQAYVASRRLAESDIQRLRDAVS
jgi:hypothetical protein